MHVPLILCETICSVGSCITISDSVRTYVLFCASRVHLYVFLWLTGCAGRFCASCVHLYVFLWLTGCAGRRIMVRAISYTVHGLVPASCVFADRYNREEVVRSLGNEINLNPPLLLSQLPDIPEELLKLDQVRTGGRKRRHRPPTRPPLHQSLSGGPGEHRIFLDFIDPLYPWIDLCLLHQGMQQYSDVLPFK